MLKLVLSAVALFVIGFQYASAGQAEGCESSAGMNYVCGPINAEDLVQVPGTRWILSSAMAPGGGIYLVDSRSGEWSQLYTAAPDQVKHDAARYGSCAGAPDLENFITHGLHLRPQDNGHALLYVVGHGGREAIEVFEVDARSDQPKLAWTGCVPMPEGLAANSVTSLSDGSLLATVLMYPGTTFSDVFSGKTTGGVYRWSPGDTGFELIPGTQLPGNNGIEVSADEREIYVVSTGLRTISAFTNTIPSRLLRSTQPLDFGPDNIHMTPDGELITAGPSSNDHDCGEMDVTNVDLEEFASCPRGSVAATFNLQTLDETRRWSRPATPVFSNATMALKVDGEIWIGTFAGNRIAIVADAP